jgi:hypothetical protein
MDYTIDMPQRVEWVNEDEAVARLVQASRKNMHFDEGCWKVATYAMLFLIEAAATSGMAVAAKKQENLVFVLLPAVSAPAIGALMIWDATRKNSWSHRRMVQLGCYGPGPSYNRARLVP